MSTLKQLYDEWFSNPDWWFNNPGIDQYLTNKYICLLDTALEINTREEQIGVVILYDQLVRHFFRNQYSEHVIEYFLQKALGYVTLLVDFMTLTPQEFCFVMLPLRHTRKTPNIMFVIKCTLQRLKASDEPLLRRFLKATFDNFPFDASTVMEHVSDTRFAWDVERYTGVLEYYPFDTRQCDETHVCYTEIARYCKKGERYIISLSGGVDSMVCAYIMKHIGCVVYAVHINYCNRDVIEEDFVRSWCQHMRICLFVRRIEEMQRAPMMELNMRELYENYTRNVRYNAYKHVWGGETPQVVLGHNRNDVFENILTNITKKKKYRDLYGMKDVSIVNGINFIRCLLGVDKVHIYEFAKRCGIPFLHDSTPAWSQRGKIRDRVRPVVQNWNVAFIPGMLEMADVMTDLHDVLDDIVDLMVANTVGLVLKLTDKPIKSLYKETFWSQYFLRLFPCYHVSQASVRHFMQKFTVFMTNKRETKIMIRKNIVCNLKEDIISFTIMS